jgi:hypothetical protein
MGVHGPLMIYFKALLALMAFDAAASKVRFRRQASRAPIPPSTVYHCRRLGPRELCADRLSFLAESSCSCLIFNTKITSRLGGSNIGSRRDLTAGGLLWLVLLPRVGGALTAAPASARKYLVSKYLVKRVARSSDAKWPEASS